MRGCHNMMSPPLPRCKAWKLSACVKFNFLHAFYYHFFLPVRPAINGSVGARTKCCSVWLVFLTSSRRPGVSSGFSPPGWSGQVQGARKRKHNNSSVALHCSASSRNSWQRLNQPVLRFIITATVMEICALL